jgi:serine/threonine protein kinase
MSKGEHERIIGDVIDEKYRIIKLIGLGGMGAVYLAVHEGTGRLVALKVITPELMTDELVVERFKREARATGQLRHPHVVNVTDFGFATAGADRLAYLVMEHLVGQTLAELLECQGQLPLPLAVDVLQQTCAAVEEAHRLGIIHRDLKPENIWLEHRAPGGYHVKVLDFGVAKLRACAQADRAATPLAMPSEREIARRERAVDPNGSTLVVPSHNGPPSSPVQSASLTMDVLLGTPMYMSPEQWLNRTVDARSDVYSLGIIAYRLLAGVAPFSGQSASLYMEHIRAPPPPLAKLAPELPAAVASVVMGALEKEPARRPASASAFATALAAAAEPSGELVRRAVTFTVDHFPALLRVSLVLYGPVLGLAALRILARRLVTAGVISAGVGHAVGGAAIVAHGLCVLFLMPLCMGLFTRYIRDREAPPGTSSRAPPTTADVLRCLRSSLVPTLLTTALALAIIVAIRAPFNWLLGLTGFVSEGATDIAGAEVVAAMVLETLTALAFARVARGLAVYPSVVAMESCGGVAALRRSAALTRPCRAVSADMMLFNFLPRALVVPWFMLAFAQFSRHPYRLVVATSADTLTGAVALTGLYLIYMLVAPFGMVALSFLYLKTRRIEGASLDAIVPAEP